MAAAGGGVLKSPVPIPPLSVDAVKKNSANDEVAKILAGLKLDKKFFLSKLQSTAEAVARNERHSQSIPEGSEADYGDEPCSPTSPTSAASYRFSNDSNPTSSRVGSADPQKSRRAKAARAKDMERKKREATRMNPADFDIYLNEAVVPVLAQSLDSLCRQLNNMDKQGNNIDPKVRERFNPLTWLAQQLLRRHPKCARTPRRQALYGNFSNWVDKERGRREMLRRKDIVEEAFMGFNLRGGVQKSTIPQVIRAIDDTLCLGGALSNHLEFRKAMGLHQIKWPGEEQEGKEVKKAAAKKSTRKATSKAQFFQGEMWSFEIFWRKFLNSITTLDVVPYTVIQQGIHELEKQAKERKQVEDAIRDEDALRIAVQREQAECKDRYSLLFDELQGNDVLKSILNDDKILTGDDVRPGDPGFEYEVAPNGRHCSLLAALLTNLGFANLENHADFGEDCWWNGDLAQAWTTLQECQNLEMQDGVVEKECLRLVLVDPENFLGLMEKVKEEIETIREEEEGFALPRSETKRSIAKVQSEKPSMEALCQRLGMPMARLQWLHQLFEGFLEGEDAICNYPEDPAELTKAQMRSLIGEVKPDISDAEFEARFQRIDEDGSGTVEFDEFAIWVRQDEVRIVGASTRKLDFEELGALYDESADVIAYLHHLFCDLLPEDEEDDYPAKAAQLAKMSVWELTKTLAPEMTEAEFETQYHLVDMESKGSLAFDEVLEVINMEELPEEIRTSAGLHAADAVAEAAAVEAKE